MRSADDTAIIAKTQQKLQNVVNRLKETGSKCGVKSNIDKSQIMRVSKRNVSLRIKLGNRELK